MAAELLDQVAEGTAQARPLQPAMSVCPGYSLSFYRTTLGPGATVSIKLPNVSKSAWLAAMIAAHSPHSCKLFSNNPTIGNATVVGDFTECTFSGYSAQNVTYGSITFDGSNRAQSICTTLTYTLTSGTQTVNGMYVVDSAGTLLYAATFGTPVTLTTTVPDLRVTPTPTQQTEF